MLLSLLALLRFLRLAPRKRSLADLDPNALRRERIQFEQAEARLTDEVARLEAEKDRQFKRGCTEISDRERRQIARKIRQIEQLISSRDRNLTLLNRNLNVVESLTQLLENQALVKEFGLSKGVLAKIDLDDIRKYVDDATVEGQVSMERLAHLLSATDTANQIFDPAMDEDSGEAELIELMRTAANNNNSGVSDALQSLARTTTPNNPAQATRN